LESLHTLHEYDEYCCIVAKQDAKQAVKNGHKKRMSN